MPATAGNTASRLTWPLPIVMIEVARLMERRIQDGVLTHDLSANQVIALVGIAHNPGVSRAELARRMRISPQAVGQLVTQLVGKGLVTRTKPGPGLPIELTVSETGYNLARKSIRAIESVNNDIAALFRPNLARALDQAMRHVLVKLGDAPVSHAPCPAGECAGSGGAVAGLDRAVHTAT